MKKRYYLNRLDVVTIILFTVACIFLSIRYYYDYLIKKSAKYQEITRIDQNSFKMCVGNHLYMFTLFQDHVQKYLYLTPEGTTVGCQSTEVDYNTTKQPQNKNKDYLMNANLVK